MFSPLMVLSAWVRGLLAVAVVALSVCLWREWYERSRVGWEAVRTADGRLETKPTNRFEFRPGVNGPTAFLLGAVGTSFWALGGGLLVTRFALGRRRKPTGTDADAGGRDERYTHARGRGEGRRVDVGSQSEIYVEVDPLPGGGASAAGRPTLIFSHGWGGNGAEWNVVRPQLRGAWKVVTWDMPGLGRSSRPLDKELSLARLAECLKRVVEGTTGADERVVLVGHSIGAMASLELARRHPDVLRGKVAGIVLAHGTYTNPLRTMTGADAYLKIQKAVIEPLLYLTIPLSPVVWGVQWLSYLQGSMHWSNHRSSFSGNETWEQLDFASRFALQASPAVLARGALGMLRWDATGALPGVDVPVLVIAGGRDTTTKPEAGARMARAIPGAELSVLGDAKHLGPIEFNEEFARRVGEFAKRRGGGGAAAAGRDRGSNVGAVEDRFSTEKAGAEWVAGSPERDAAGR
jgi:pimeloyl-ACP methyl ester carboxylesterase